MHHDGVSKFWYWCPMRGMSLILLGLMQEIRGKWNWPIQFWPTINSSLGKDLLRNLGIMAKPRKWVSYYLRLYENSGHLYFKTLDLTHFERNQKSFRYLSMKVPKCLGVRFEIDCWNTAESWTLNPPTYP